MNAEQNTVAQNGEPTIRIFTPHDVHDAQAIMHGVCRMGEGGAADHVTRAAWLLLSGILVHLAYAQEAANGDVSLDDVIDWMNGDWEDPPRQLVSEMIFATYKVSKDSDEPVAHPFVKGVASMMFLMNREDLPRVVTSAMTFAHLGRFAKQSGQPLALGSAGSVSQD